MQLALDKYKIFKGSGTWMKKTDQELQLVAMKAELFELRQNAQAIQKVPTKEKTGKGKSGKTRNDKFAWKGVAPKSGEPLTKTVGGKVYIYCPHHVTTCWVLETNQQGVLHRTGCRKMIESGNTPPAAGSQGAVPTEQQRRYAAALASVMEQDASLDAGDGSDAMANIVYDENI